MSNNYYTPTGNPTNSSALNSPIIRTEFSSIEAGFDKISPLSGNGGLPVFVNAGGTAQEAKSLAAAQSAMGMPTLSGNGDKSLFVNTGGTAIETKTASAARSLLGLGTAAVSAATDFTAAAHAGAGGTAHADVVAGGAAGFMSGADKTKLDAVGANANNYVHPNHSGEVTSLADGAQTIAANAVTFAKMQDITSSTVIGRKTSGTGDPESLSASDLQTLIMLDTLIDVVPSINNTWNGRVMSAVAGENLAIGDVCYLKSDGKFWKADADAEATSKGMLMMATNTIAGDASGLFLRKGFIRNDSWSFTVGAELFIHTTPGGPTSTKPSGTGDIVRIVGYAYTTSIVYFDPDKSYVEVT